MGKLKLINKPKLKLDAETRFNKILQKSCLQIILTLRDFHTSVSTSEPQYHKWYNLIICTSREQGAYGRLLKAVRVAI